MDALKLRKDIKKRKPAFLRADGHKRTRVGTKWRRPKGLQNKMRLAKKGYRVSVSRGYGSPKAVYGLHPKGLAIVTAANPEALKGLDPKVQGAEIPATVGLQKRIAILSAAAEAGITVLNYHDTKKALADLKASFEAAVAARKEKKAAKGKKKAASKKSEKGGRKKEKAKAAPEKEEPGEETPDAHEKEKEEKDKVLTKRV